MIENNGSAPDTKKEYYEKAKMMGKKEFTLLKMQEYGFWPENLKTPYERQQNETQEEYNARQKLFEEYSQLAAQIAELYEEKSKINEKLLELKKQFADTWDYQKIRKDVANQIMKESIQKRAERKAQREQEKKQKTEAWKAHRAENIVFIGKGYSNFLFDKENDLQKLQALHLPIIEDDKALANLLGIRYQDLRLLAYHRDVVTVDNYHRYTVPKRSGGLRNIAAPKPILKLVQRRILESILNQIAISPHAHGFLKGKSVVTGAAVHVKQPTLLITMDIEDFFPTITFERVRGMFHSFGYSGYISSLLAMLVTYCERMPIEVKGEVRYVKTSDRILPQGSPASPMITNIICRNLDQKLSDLCQTYGAVYTRYADDMSFSFLNEVNQDEVKNMVIAVKKCVYQEGFRINKKKTRFLKSNNRQCVTGIVINNDQLGVPKVWVKKMRAAIYNAGKQIEKGPLSPERVSELKGMASWLQAVNGKRYQGMIEQVDNLLKNC